MEDSRRLRRFLTIPCVFIILLVVGCRATRTTDVSTLPVYASLIGKIDILDGRDYFLYDNGHGEFFVDVSTEIFDGRSVKVGVLREGTPVVIERILRNSRSQSGVTTTFEDVPIVAVLHPNTKQRIRAKSSFIYLRDSASFHKTNISLEK